MALGNRGPIRFDADGALDPDILAAFSRCGFYVFEDVLGADELSDIEADLHDILERLPVEKGALVDARGRPALGVGCEAPTLFWSKPLGDPFGGTSQGQQPTPGQDDRTDARAGRPRRGRLPHPRLAPVLRSGAPRLRPPEAPGGRRRGQRRGLRAVQRGRCSSRSRAAAPRSPGTRTASPTGTARTGTRAATASTSWRSSTAALPPTACGSFPAPTGGARWTSRG